MASELSCYTIINNPYETETPNEQQIKHDLGIVSHFLSLSLALSCLILIYREL